MSSDDIIKSLDACFDCPNCKDCLGFQEQYIKALKVLLKRLDSLSKRLDSNGKHFSKDSRKSASEY